MGKYIIGITGASGSVYAKRVIERLVEKGHHVYVCMTAAGKMVAGTELGWDIGQDTPAEEVESFLGEQFGSRELVHSYDIRSIGAPIASGSFGVDGMIVVPCSMGTLSAICHGSSHNLLERAADVCLKERRPLVIVPREAPYNQIHLENMTKLAGYGAVMMPASPGFYSGPKTIEELVDFFVIRMLDQLGIHEQTEKRWNGMEQPCGNTL